MRSCSTRRRGARRTAACRPTATWSTALRDGSAIRRRTGARGKLQASAVTRVPAAQRAGCRQGGRRYGVLSLRPVALAQRRGLRLRAVCEPPADFHAQCAARRARLPARDARDRDPRPQARRGRACAPRRVERNARPLGGGARPLARRSIAPLRQPVAAEPAPSAGRYRDPAADDRRRLAARARRSTTRRRRDVRRTACAHGRRRRLREAKLATRLDRRRTRPMSRRRASFLMRLLLPRESRRCSPTSPRLPPRSRRRAPSTVLRKRCSSSPSPGVPDIYQGTEFWDFSLVDPDNRAAGRLRRARAQPRRRSHRRARGGLARRPHQAGGHRARARGSVRAIRELFAGATTCRSRSKVRLRDHIVAFARRLEDGNSDHRRAARFTSLLMLAGTASRSGPPSLERTHCACRPMPQCTIDATPSAARRSTNRRRRDIAAICAGLPVALLVPLMTGAVIVSRVRRANVYARTVHFAQIVNGFGPKIRRHSRLVRQRVRLAAAWNADTQHRTHGSRERGVAQSGNPKAAAITSRCVGSENMASRSGARPASGSFLTHQRGRGVVDSNGAVQVPPLSWRGRRPNRRG